MAKRWTAGQGEVGEAGNGATAGHGRRNGDGKIPAPQAISSAVRARGGATGHGDADGGFKSARKAAFRRQEQIAGGLGFRVAEEQRERVGTIERVRG